MTDTCDYLHGTLERIATQVLYVLQLRKPFALNSYFNEECIIFQVSIFQNAHLHVHTFTTPFFFRNSIFLVLIFTVVKEIVTL